MKCVILAGGLGTRLREETKFLPKPLVKIGGKPIIWHLIKYYNYFGVKEFIICAGYKGEMLTNYFSQNLDLNDIRVQVVDTGEHSNTGERLRRIRQLVEGESFYCTYGDGLSNIDLNEVRLLHKKNNTIGTLCSARPISRFGVIEADQDNLISSFQEKQQMDSWVNIGFFIFERKIFEYLKVNSILETDVLIPLTKLNQLSVHKHAGFWQPMDTYREVTLLNNLWKEKKSPWKIWEK